MRKHTACSCGVRDIARARPFRPKRDAAQKLRSKFGLVFLTGRSIVTISRSSINASMPQVYRRRKFKSRGPYVAAQGLSQADFALLTRECDLA